MITAQKMTFSISKCDQIRKKLRIWSYLLKKSLMENFIFLWVDLYLNYMMPSKIEEADERALLHTLDASESFDEVLVKTVDSDVV